MYSVLQPPVQPTPEPLSAPAQPARHRYSSLVRWMLVAGFFCWLITVVIGFGLLSSYKSTPGDSGIAPPTWPAGINLSPSESGATLVMFVHPHCPCTRATFSELERLIARCHDRVGVRVVFTRPDGADQDWVETDLWRAARQIPGAEVSTDDGGQLAARFGAATSGHTVLYGHNGRLLYSGGITVSRGHEGDNAGRSTIEQLLLGGASKTIADQGQPVFGCPLRSDQAAGTQQTTRGTD